MALLADQDMHRKTEHSESQKNGTGQFPTERPLGTETPGLLSPRSKAQVAKTKGHPASPSSTRSSRFERLE